MKTTTSFWKRCLAWAMALVLLVSGSNLGVALQAFATEDGGASLTAGEIVAAHYDLPEGQKALLKSSLLDYGETYSFTDVCSEKGLVSVDTKTREITAKTSGQWSPVSADILVDGKTVQTVSLTDGKGTYKANLGNAFTVAVKYVARQNVPADVQTALLNAAGYLKQGVANTEAVAGQEGNLYALEQAMPQLVDFAENGIETENGYVRFSADCKAAVAALNAQMTANNGKLNLSTMIDTYKAGTKTGYLMNHGSEMKAEVANTNGYLTTLSTALDTIAKNMDFLVSQNWVSEEVANQVKTLASMVKNLNTALTALTADPWDALNVKLVTNADYAKLDTLVAALDETSVPTVENPLTAATDTVKVNVALVNVTVNYILMTVEDKADSDKLVEAGKETVTLTLSENATAEDVLAAVKASGIADKAAEAWGEAFSAEHFESASTTLPETLTKDTTYTVTYTPKTYTVSTHYSDDLTVPYGYKLTLPVHEDSSKAYDYKVNDVAFAQGTVVVITGNTNITRTAGKAYTVTDLMSVIADNYGNGAVQAILKSGALLGNQPISVRKPDPADAENILTLKDGVLTANATYAADFKDLNWVPYTYGVEGTENLFSGNTAQWEGKKEAKVQYILNLTYVTEAQAEEILTLAKTLKSEADGQNAALTRLMGYYSTIGELDRTKLGAINGVVDVTDFTPDDGTDEDEANLAMRAYFKDLISKILRESVDSDGHLKIYNMLTGYSAENGGLRYYYANNEAILHEVSTLSGYLTGLVADDEKEAALRIMVKAAGYEQYADKISNLEQALAEVNRDLKAPNAAIDLTSSSLGKLVDALNTKDTLETKQAGTPYLLSDVLTALDDTQVNVQVILQIGSTSKTFTTTGFDIGHVVTKAEMDELQARLDEAVKAQLGEKADFYDVTEDSVDLSTLVGTTLNKSFTGYLTYEVRTYTVKIDGEKDQLVTIEKSEIELPKNSKDGWVYYYNVGTKTDVKEGHYTLTAADLLTADSNNVLTLTRKAVNEGGEKLEATIAKLNANAQSGNSYALEKDTEGNITGIVANVAANKNGLTSFGKDLVNCGYSYVGLNGEGFLYLTESDSLELCLQALIDAVLNNDEFGSQTLIDLGRKNGGKVITTNMQLGQSADEIEYSNLSFTLNLTSVPDKMLTVSKGLDKIRNYFSFHCGDGHVAFDVTLPEKVYQVYLTGLLATGDVDKSDMNAIDSKIAYQFLYDYVMDVVRDDTVTTTTFSNTLELLGKDKDLTGYEEYYQLVRKALNSDGMKIDITTDPCQMSAEASGQAILNVVESLGFDLSKYETYMGMVKELKDGGSIHADATAQLTDTENDYEAALIDLKADRKLNKFDYTSDLVARSQTVANQAAIMLLGDVDGDLTFNGFTVLDLNGHTINGNITSNKNLFIFDSTMDTFASGGINGTISGTATIIGGKYTSDVSAFLNDGYVQENGTVRNKAYTIESDGNDVTFLLDTGFIRDGENVSLKTLAADMAVDLALNYFTAASLSADGHDIYAANFNDLLGLWKSDTTRTDLVNMIFECFQPSTNDFINEVIADLLDFASIKDALKNGKDVATYTVATTPWAVELEHVEDGDYLSAGIVANTESANAKSFTASLRVSGKYADKAAELAGALADIVVADNTFAKVHIERPSYSDKTVYVSGSGETSVDIDLTVDKDYQTVLAVILAYGNADKAADLVAGIGNSPKLREVFDSMTVEEVFTALKVMSRNVSFEQMAASVGAGDIGNAAELERVFHVYLCAAGKALEKLDITGYTDKTMGQLRGECGRYTLTTSVKKHADVTKRGYTLDATGVAESVTLSVNIFGNEHVWGEWQYDEDGHWRECTACGAIEEKEPHVWGDWTVTKEATCTEEGEETRECTVCHKTETRVTEKIDHSWSDWKHDEESHWRECTVCGEITDKAAHEWGDWTVTKEATCVENGEETRECSVCGEKQTRETEKVDHVWGDWTVTKEATCTEEGEETHECTVCHKTETRVTEKIDHSWSDWKHDEESHWRECSVCGEITDKAAHEWGDWTVTKEATCVENGEETRTCSVCGEKQTRETEKVDHVWGEWKVTKEATCTEEGEETRECSVCGEKETRKIDKIDHTWSDWKHDADNHWRECTVCGEITDKAAHEWGDWTVTKEATCKDEGEKTRTCAVCGEKQTESIDKVAHKWGEWKVTKEATCTEDGERTRTCSVCQEEQKETIVKTGHSFGEWVVTKEPTCVDEGERTRSCSACGEKETEVIPATGKHTYGDEWKSDEDGHWHECTVCGVHSEKENHTYEWVIDKKATETEAGVKHEECSVCHHKRNENTQIPATKPSDPTEPTKPTVTPGTGDNMMEVWTLFLLASAALAAFAVLTASKKRSK